jgi:hypothetical protein
MSKPKKTTRPRARISLNLDDKRPIPLRPTEPRVELSSGGAVIASFKSKTVEHVAHGDYVVQVNADGGRYDIVSKLRELSDVVGGTVGDDLASAEILLLCRRSPRVGSGSV